MTVADIVSTPGVPTAIHRNPDESETGTVNDSTTNKEDREIALEIRELKAREREVMAHERAHKMVGGPYAGGVQYEYQRGPDGRMYIAGGEVSIDVSEASSPSETIKKMKKVKAAAMAPADPSPQDRAVAAKAARIEAEARMELKAEEGGTDTHATSASRDSLDQHTPISLYV